MKFRDEKGKTVSVINIEKLTRKMEYRKNSQNVEDLDKNNKSNNEGNSPYRISLESIIKELNQHLSQNSQNSQNSYNPQNSQKSVLVTGENAYLLYAGLKNYVETELGRKIYYDEHFRGNEIKKRELWYIIDTNNTEVYVFENQIPKNS